MKEEGLAPGRAAASMGATVSRLMDGEAEHEEFERCLVVLRSDEAMRTWASYHVIGDALRGAPHGPARVSARLHSALAAEPTVLAPQPSRARAAAPATFAWAVAATVAAVTVVGWTAFSMIDVPPGAVAKAREATSVRAAQVKPPGEVTSEYLIAHQEYSPAVAIRGAAPYLRAATATAVERGPER